ncbi:MAG TPA: cyclic 2,3-diphosphoglycerate synthase [Candidatus Polarisedimenticolia bacterium]|nr:cyclic 2,3-diphosphoglycerate synthase [Candidatus Polarisedimenticolia bacterium]
MNARKVLIMGAAGRDFHNFNVALKDRDDIEVVGFTATQIPNIDNRVYPAGLSGARYPKGIPIFPESELSERIRELGVDEVIFAYSDVSHEHVMRRASLVLATGADFRLMGANATMLKAKVPVISVCAVRTGSGKSQTTRRVCRILAAKGRKVVAVRHPMPYGDLERQRVQRFATLEDLDTNRCTIEEREEYEPHIHRGTIIYSGVDYAEILHQAEREADVIVWDGGNNDLPFYRPDLEIVVADPLRPGHELTYHPGTTNLYRAGCVVINKIDAAAAESVTKVRDNIRRINPKAIIVEAASPLTVENSATILGKRVLVVEDGPTLTHGEMKFGAGVAAAHKFGASSLVDPRPFAVGSIRKIFEEYPETGVLLPAVGYGEAQMEDLRKTIDASDCDLVIIATPIDLRRTIRLKKPALRVTYELQEIGKPDLDDVLARF